MGVAEAAANTSPRYTVLWRRLDENGQFSRYSGGRIFEARTNEGETLQVRGIPGEFVISEIEPGTYALDSAFAVLRDGRVNYIANGVVQGPERPSFTVRAGEAVYLGIWEVDIEDSFAVVRPWRLQQDDLDAVLREVAPVIGAVRVIEPEARSVPCTPLRINTDSQRRICVSDGQ
jgi:hypothetical protein